MSARPSNSRIARISAAFLILGFIGWILALIFGDPSRAWRSLLINFIFFTPMAAGMVTWPAAVTAARGGQWLPPVKNVALAAIGFAPLSIIALILLWIGASYWAPWFDKKDLHNYAWLNWPFLFSRDLVALLIFWFIAGKYVLQARHAPAKILGIWVILVYCAVFTLLAFDLVMALDPHWYSTLFGGYYFISGMYTAVAAWTIAAMSKPNPADPDHRQDFGRLIVAFSLLTTYMMYSQLLPIWYENLPNEARFVAPRLNFTSWQQASGFLLVTIYLGPLVLLLTRWSKRSVAYLWGMSFLVLAGMWIERWWLVVPDFSPFVMLGFPEITLAVTFAAGFVFFTQQAYWRLGLHREDAP